MDNTEQGAEARILEAAQQVFTRDGFDGARMQVIAETAGINKALLHYYFRSKKKLFEKVLEDKMRTFLPEIQAAFESKQTAVEKIEAFVETYLKLLGRHPHLPMFVLFSVHRNPEMVEKLPKTPFHKLIHFLRGEIKAGRMREVDPEHFFVSILSMCLFPFLSKHMAGHMLGKSHAEYDDFLAKRKSEIMEFVKPMFLS